MAVRFDNTSDELRLTTNLPTIDPFTVLMFVKLSVNKITYTCPFSVDNGTGDWIYMETDSDGVTLRLWDDTTGSSSGTALQMGIMTVGDWYVIGFSNSGTTLTGYFAPLFSPFTSGSISSSSLTIGNLRIGQSPWAGEYLDGCVCGVKIWQDVLTTRELENERTQYLPQKTKNLYAFYSLLNAPYANMDESGNAHTTTVFGTLDTEPGPPIPWAINNPPVLQATLNRGYL